MTARHPGGEAAALRLVEMAGITPPCRLIDLGAGAGGTARLLRSLGFEALGIDLLPEFEYPTVALVTIYPNADPETV